MYAKRPSVTSRVDRWKVGGRIAFSVEVRSGEIVQELYLACELEAPFEEKKE